MPSPADDIPAHYHRHATAWAADRLQRPWHDWPWLRRFADALPSGAAVLDLGCGPGAPVAVLLAARGLTVTGIDAAPSMIALARRRLPGADFRVGDMRALALGRRFAGILAWDSFFHLAPDDQRRLFAVFALHAAPGAYLMFNTGTEFGARIGEYRGDPLYHASLDLAEYRTLLDRHGFAVVAHAVRDPAAGGRTAWLAEARDAAA